MRTSTAKTFNFLNNQSGFSLIEIMVALLLAALVFLAIPSGDSTQIHRDLKTAVDDIERSIRFATNESVLRNTVVRLKFSLDKEPMEYTVEYGPAGNVPLPDLPEKISYSLAEEKERNDKLTALNKQFTTVEEFEDIKHEIHPNVSILGVASSAQKKIQKEGEVSIYFYPTGEKDAALIFFSTIEEFAYLEVEPFMSETRNVFDTISKDSVAKLEDLLQTKMDEVHKEWMKE